MTNWPDVKESLRMPALLIVGGSWGDEGKGKIIDYLAADADVVARFSGGNNAGHTVMNEKGEFKLHLLPSGIFWPQTACVIGNGAVVDPEVLISEIRELTSQGIDVTRLTVSDRAHLIMPYHVLLDNLEETARGSGSIGTTGRGVGPAYVDKTSRLGIRAIDLLNLDRLRPRLENVLDIKNQLIEKIYAADPLSIEDIWAQCEKWSQVLSPYIGNTGEIIRQALDEGKVILLEGAQGALLDLDHGTYPYVTSSNPTVGGAVSGLGLSPRSISSVVGVFKAYTTRVGSGPFPTELLDSVGEEIRERAWEYGSTTGRPRRCGWFDGVAAGYSARLNDYTSMILTRLDILDGFETVKVCVGYRVDGRVVDGFPTDTEILTRCEPIYEEIPGWEDPTAGATDMNQIPSEAQYYIKRLEEIVGKPVSIVSTGPNREQTLRTHIPL